jgi:serine/threonine-protein kinase
LDFGLAKMLETESVSSSLSASPTLSAHPTYAGVILGTASYMSPEQARGKQVDRRTDIWSFGCVLFEMLTGKLAFEGGETVSDVVASVLKGEPDWNALSTTTPPHIRKLLRRCLQKDVKKRLPHIGIARIEIDEGPADAPSDAGAVNVIPSPVSKWHRTVPWALAGLALLGMITFFLRPRPTPQPAAPVWVSAELGGDVSLFTNQGSAPGDSLALSRDGTMLAFVGLKGTTRKLYFRRLGQLKAVALDGTEGARDPFFSPDGKWIAFFADRGLKKVAVTGGATVPLSDISGVNNDRGGTWSEDDTIIYSAGPNTGLARVSSAGGKPEQLTNLLGPTQRWPQSLPDGKGVLYTVRSSPTADFDDAHIVIQPSSASQPKVVLRGGYFGRYLASGHLVYIHAGTLFAAPFDLNKLEVIGQSVPVIEGVASNSGSAGANFTVSDNGTLVFLPGEGASSDAPIQWLQRDGKISELRSLAADWSNPHFSPDGRRLAVDVRNQQGVGIGVYEWARDTFTRLTFDSANDTKPVWTPDGQRIVFASTRGHGSTSNLYWQRSDGTGEIQRLTDSPNSQSPGSWHPSGKFLVFQEQTGGPSTYDLMILPMEGNEASGWKPGKPTPFLSTPATETDPMFSPDGRWIAYQSQESGILEVYVRPFPGPGGPWQISSEGGQLPTWSRTRNEVFYRSPDNRIMEVTYVVEGNSFKAEKPKTWSDRVLIPRHRFDLHPDGNRFAVALADAGVQAPTDKVIFVFNFFEELRRIAPVRP